MSNELSNFDKLLAKFPSIPSPISYLQSVIREDTPERVAAFLAVIAGIALVIGFVGIITAITFFKQKLTTELITVSGALVSLATFNKVDRSSTSISTSTSSSTTTPAAPPNPAKLPGKPETKTETDISKEVLFEG